MSLDIYFWEDTDTISILEDSLRAGEVILGASDTVLGLLSAFSHAGVDRLNSIKERSLRPYITLISDKEKTGMFAQLQIDMGLDRLMTQCWPGPLTIIFNVKQNVPAYLASADNKIALRVPRHAGLLSLLNHFDGLFSTSANKSGQPIPTSVQDVDPDIIDAVSHIVLDRNDMHKDIIPSTILDCSGDQIRVVREGAYAISELETVYGSLFA